MKTLRKLSILKALEVTLIGYLAVGLLTSTTLAIVGLVDLIGR